jgi:hypothetical protein
MARTYKEKTRLAKLDGTILDYIKAHPGCYAKEISTYLEYDLGMKGYGVSTTRISGRMYQSPFLRKSVIRDKSDGSYRHYVRDDLEAKV